ncbi:hypothetical protein T11_6736 [Trichinella zimbabwensis]|uniref:Uncharacterized protein n=1 Tax=Trichinella zimbabwensis TaxID=268475 RepID=A0A0V1I1A6_9BILA|nr:hypothetical protein T11_6736 [Trichinella zimbabwensis]
MIQRLRQYLDKYAVVQRPTRFVNIMGFSATSKFRGL